MDYISKHNITGRGLVYVIKSDASTHIKIGDAIKFDDDDFIVTGFERMRDLLMGETIEDVGILVRPVYSKIRRCPKCGSRTDFTIEKMLNGNTTCLACKYVGKHVEFFIPKTETKLWISHDGWSGMLPETLVNHIKKLESDIIIYQKRMKLLDLYIQLAVVRKQQLVGKEAGCIATAKYLEDDLCIKIEKLLLELAV